MRISDIRGAFQLATQATTGVTRIVEGVHQSVWSTMGFPGGPAPGKTRGITGLVYKTIHEITRASGNSADTVITGLHTLFPSAQDKAHESAGRQALLSALNGVMGDRLEEDNSPFAIPMTLRYGNKIVTRQARLPVPDASAKVLVLIHGLCMSDLQQQARHKRYPAEHGEALASALGYSPIYLRYNSGLHISLNGRELSAQLEQVHKYWPVEIEELTVVAHSMGGLLIRSALHDARRQRMHWPGKLRNIVFLGTPHHGAPLERIGNWLDVILNTMPYTKPFSALGRLRSPGITDLRYGNVLHEDWQGHDRFQRTPDKRRPLPLPDTVNCYTVAATVAEKRSTLADRLIGDGVVPLRSALGQHAEAQKTLAFAKSARWIAYRTNHMQLLYSPEVISQVTQWLKTKNTG